MGYWSGFVNSWDKYDIVWVAAIFLVLFITYRVRQLSPAVWEIVKDHFSVVVLFLALLLTLAVTVHLIHDKSDAASVQWAEGLVTGLVNTLALALGFKKPADGSLNGNGDAVKHPPTDAPKV